MDVQKAITQRRSVRKYQDKEIPDSLIRELIEAARLAPSAYNSQPSKFYIIKKESDKKRLKENNVFKQEFVYAAPVIIVCCGNSDAFPAERFEPVYSSIHEIGGEIGAVRDVSIATQNLVLRATELGLGACYIGLVNRSKLKEILNIPQNYVLPFVIILGYPDEKPEATPRKELKEFVINEL
jgi:nitroreductase